MTNCDDRNASPSPTEAAQASLRELMGLSEDLHEANLPGTNARNFINASLFQRDVEETEWLMTVMRHVIKEAGNA